MINVNLDIKNKIKETTKGMLLEIGEYETWFPIKDTIIDEKNKKIALKIIEDFYYKLGKKSITKDIESVKGSDILKYIKNIPNITTNENELISCEFYEKYNGYYIFKNDKNQECFKYNITWEQDMKSFKINNPYNDNDLAINYIVTSMKNIETHNQKIFYLKY
ncbi:MAG: hypothetical protein PPFGHCPK_01263 [Spiroplasma endosymbiont of Drosophila atripex]|nr:MAG: hypothetical protein PPFGHCPK_00326 [Spiroplasma endosymbiont of Drosophila atripex]WDA54793.1 MAG: hypothetical protein PPFGHCPK_01263 [Spiroplasma endosymbiont of Drosophila atripex]